MEAVMTWQPPFSKQNKVYKKRSLTKYTKQAGVYFIKENGLIVYVGMSASNVVEALYRHFYKWRDCYRGMGCEYRTTYVDYLDNEDYDYQVAILVISPEQVNEVERALIWSLKPRDNRYRYEDYFEIKQLNTTENADSNEQYNGDDLPF